MSNQQKLSVGILYPAPVAENRAGNPLYLCLVPAGWPSPAEDYVEERLDLHKLAVRNQASTFFLHASGDSMIGAGIHDGDLLVVDRSVNPVSGSVVIAALDGDLTVKRLAVRGCRRFLQPENPRYKTIEITDREDVYVWGVVTYVLHKLGGGKTLGAR